MAETGKESKPVRKGGGKPDIATFVGIAVALAGIVGGLVLEGGKLQDVAQITAAIIVLGGTCGAVMVSTDLVTMRAALRRFVQVFFSRVETPDAIVEEIIGYATKARKNGLVSLEQDAGTVEDPYLRKALNLAVDGTDIQELRSMMDLEIQLQESRAEAEAKVFESAGGFAPTIGIIGAVMGLIQVMKNLGNIDEVGHGIAVSFVATVYGVGLANLILLPAATKIRTRVVSESQRRELILEGVIGIVEGLNPKLIRSKLEAYSTRAQAPKPKGSEAKADLARAAVMAEG